MIRRIVSGGQTGADRAALDVGAAWPLETGGWVPRGRVAEDGAIPTRYGGLRETESDRAAERTELNVRDSDGTLIISHGELRGGSLLTLHLAERHGRPALHLDMAVVTLSAAIDTAAAWVEAHGIATLNVAGSRASMDDGIYLATARVLSGLLARLRA